MKGSPVAAVCWLWRSLGGTIALQSCREKRGSRCPSSPDPHCATLLLVTWATKKMPHFLSLEKLIYYQKCSIHDGAGERDIERFLPRLLFFLLHKNIAGARDLITGNQSKENTSILDTKQARQRTRTFSVVCSYH